MRGWTPTIIAWTWLAIVQGVWGIAAAVLCGVSMLAVCLVAFWEAGSKRSSDEADNPAHP